MGYRGLSRDVYNIHAKETDQVTHAGAVKMCAWPMLVIYTSVGPG